MCSYTDLGVQKPRMLAPHHQDDIFYFKSSGFPTTKPSFANFEYPDAPWDWNIYLHLA